MFIPGEGGGAMSRDELIDSLAVDILGKLPPQYEVWRVRKQFEMNITPTLVVLLQELERFDVLNIIIGTSCEESYYSNSTIANVFLFNIYISLLVMLVL